MEFSRAIPWREAAAAGGGVCVGGGGPFHLGGWVYFRLVLITQRESGLRKSAGLALARVSAGNPFLFFQNAHLFAPDNVAEQKRFCRYGFGNNAKTRPDRNCVVRFSIEKGATTSQGWSNCAPWSKEIPVTILPLRTLFCAPLYTSVDGNGDRNKKLRTQRNPLHSSEFNYTGLRTFALYSSAQKEVRT